MTREGGSPPPVFLDPFAFPSETKGRFRMLLAAALALAWSLGSHLVAVPKVPIIPADISPETREVLDRMIARETDPLTPEERSKMRGLFRSYVPMMEYGLLKLVLSVFLLFAIVAGTVFLYLRQPGRLRRRYGARPLTPEESPRVTADLKRLALRIGLPRVPRWEYRPGFFDGLALGPRGREVVVISGSPKLLEAIWSDVHRAVVLHELAHFVNGDVRIREISWSLWRTLVWTVAVLGCGIAVVSLATGELRVPLFGESSRTCWDFFGAAGKTALILLVAGWIWAELIRVREFYADWRVATWGFREPLRQRLRLTSSYSPPWRSSRLSRALRHHPSNERRLEVLDDPSQLFRVTPELAFLSGFLLALPLMGFLFLAFPATVVAAMGVGLWYFVGRRQDEDLERKIALWRSEGAGLGESAAGVNGFPGRPPVKTHPKLVKIVVSLLTLAGLFVILWGLTSLVLLGTWEEARQHASQRAGAEIDAAAMTVGGLIFLSIGLLPLATAAGIWGLHRRDVRLQERWRRATRSRTSSEITPPRVSRSQADW